MIPARVEELLLTHVPGLVEGRRPATAHQPETGNRSEVWLVTFDSGEGAVLRVTQPASLCAEMGRVLRRCEKRALPVPRALAWTPLIRRITHRAEGLLVEELVPGKIWTDADFEPETCLAVMRALARLHDDVRVHNGPFGGWRASERHERLLRITLKDLARARKTMQSSERPDFDALEKLVRNVHSGLPCNPAQSLIHARIGKSDVMISSDGEAVFLDCESLRYDHFAYDLFDVLQMIERNNPGMPLKSLVETYYGHRRALPDGFEFDVIEPFFLTALHIRRLRSFLTKGPEHAARRDEEIPRAVKGLADALARFG